MEVEGSLRVIEEPDEGTLDEPVLETIVSSIDDTRVLYHKPFTQLLFLSYRKEMYVPLVSNSVMCSCPGETSRCCTTVSVLTSLHVIL